MPSYKFSDFINYEGNKLQEVFRIEEDWFQKACEVVAKAGAMTMVDNRLNYFEAMTKAVDENLEITSINQLVFLMLIIEETKEFKKETFEKNGNDYKVIVEVMSEALSEFEKYKYK